MHVTLLEVDSNGKNDHDLDWTFKDALKEPTVEDTTIRWMSADEIIQVGITSGAKKVINAIEGRKKTASKPKKRKQSNQGTEIETRQRTIFQYCKTQE